VLAGGRYDGLFQGLGVDKSVPAVGWAAGVDRLSLLLEDDQVENIDEVSIQIGVIPVQEKMSHDAPDAVHARNTDVQLRALQVNCQLLKRCRFLCCLAATLKQYFGASKDRQRSEGGDFVGEYF
jgi:histidyl-tRNA synthetase